MRLLPVSTSLILVFAIIQTSFSQNTIIVSTTGNNTSGTGSLNNPYATLQHALLQSVAGDTIYLRGGTYPSDEIRIETDHLVISSYPGEWATIEAPIDVEDITSCLWYHEPQTRGGTLKNLEIKGGYYYGIKLESDWNWGYPVNERSGVSGLTIHGCRIHDTGRDCIKITPACDDITIESCEIFNSGIGAANAGDPNAEGIDCVNGDRLTVRFCYIHDISTTGVYAKGGAKDCLIESNLVKNCGENGILLGFYTDEEWFDPENNPELYENINGTVCNNYVIRTGYDGIGLYAALNPKVYNNTVIDAARIDHAALFFNTGYIWLEATQGMYAPPTRNPLVVNNIFSVSSDAPGKVAQIRYYEEDLNSNMVGDKTIDRNLYYREGGANFDDGVDWQALSFDQWKMSTGLDESSLEANPVLDGNFHLAAGSPCIDQARLDPTPVYDYDGYERTEPFDIGADESGTGEALLIPPAAGVVGTGNARGGVNQVGIIPVETGFVLRQNPVDRVWMIEVADPAADCTIEVLSLTGQKIFQDTFTAHFEWSYAGFSSGIYLVTVTIGETVSCQKVFW